jgi:ABC-2 type transport system ATP-binding protein
VNPPDDTQADAPAVELRQLSHRYADELVLRDIDLTIRHKTTAVNILTTLIEPTSGVARVCGFDVVTARGEVTERIGYLPADVRMYPHLTARENLEFFAALSGVDDVGRVVEDTLCYLDCADLADRRVGSFSTGMRQRIGIAQAIVHRPTVLFLDEPTSGLDPAGVRQLRETILRLNRELGMTVFMNTHLLSEVAKVCTTIGVLNHGELIYKDTIEDTVRRFPDEASLEDIYVRMESSTSPVPA